ncbi:hypothetical protein ACWEQL_37005 [Kitasatospora sp. NPDC004240]
MNIDDCWTAPSRDAAGNLVPDPVKFPNGIAAVADHVHALGLKLGIYEDAGTRTCAGLPGSLGRETRDAALFASWGVDLLKYDNCNNNGLPSRPRYTAMRDALRATGRPILFSLCNWGRESPWLWGAGTGSMWRTTGDIQVSYSSVLSIFHGNVGLGAYAGPGHWNDPDMLEVGNGMSATEDRTHFSLWSMMAAPLLAGNDITEASAETLAILTNTRVIAVNQDPLGRQAHLVSSTGGHNVLAKPLANGDVAVALFNESDSPATITTTVGTVGKSGASSYTLTDLWSGGTGSTTGTITATLPAHATAVFRLSGGNTPVLNAGVLNGAGSGRCIDVPKGSATPGARLTIWDCNGDSGRPRPPVGVAGAGVSGGGRSVGTGAGAVVVGLGDPGGVGRLDGPRPFGFRAVLLRSDAALGFVLAQGPGLGLEDAHRPPEAAGHVGQLLGAEQQEDDGHHDQQVPGFETVAEHP